MQILHDNGIIYKLSKMDILDSLNSYPHGFDYLFKRLSKNQIRICLGYLLRLGCPDCGFRRRRLRRNGLLWIGLLIIGYSDHDYLSKDCQAYQFIILFSIYLLSSLHNTSILQLQSSLYRWNKIYRKIHIRMPVRMYLPRKWLI